MAVFKWRPTPTQANPGEYLRCMNRFLFKRTSFDGFYGGGITV